MTNYKIGGILLKSGYLAILHIIFESLTLCQGNSYAISLC